MSSTLNTASSAVLYAENEHKGIDLFIPAPSEILWSFVVVAVLAVFFYRFVLSKMDEVFDKRAEKIDGELVNASNIKAEAEKLYADYTSQIKHAKLEAAKIKDDARNEAAHIISSAKIKASNDAELIVKNAYRAVASESKRVENLLKKEVGSLAMSITQSMLQKGVDNTQRQSKILDAALDKFESSFKEVENDGKRELSNKNVNSRSGAGADKNAVVKRISSSKFAQTRVSRFYAKPRAKDELED
ncbi:MAG: F0F1 ATP synthase subunit B [Candidatus Ancillula trichonymphae]|jgi:F-type H+-transporting ATPase subunit b|nr:F0F1 ATP synthase subunit B [Candidatus Ancillula trichonymphae]